MVFFACIAGLKMHHGAIQVNFYPILTRQIATVYCRYRAAGLGHFMDELQVAHNSLIFNVLLILD